MHGRRGIEDHAVRGGYEGAPIDTVTEDRPRHGSVHRWREGVHRTIEASSSPRGYTRALRNLGAVRYALDEGDFSIDQYLDRARAGAHSPDLELEIGVFEVPYVRDEIRAELGPLSSV